MSENISRQKFLQYTAVAGAAVLLSSLEGLALTTDDKKLKVAVIGCGSVSNRYLPQLLSSKMIEVVSLCDIKYDRAVNQNKEYKVNAQTYPNIEAMLKGVPFDMMVTLTDMQVHGHLNKIALTAGNMCGVKSQWPIPMLRERHYWILQEVKSFGFGAR